jgi:hypothetical protein
VCVRACVCVCDDDHAPRCHSLPSVHIEQQTEGEAEEEYDYAASKLDQMMKQAAQDDAMDKRFVSQQCTRPQTDH